MPLNDPYTNPVPLGVAGTGSAFILPESKVVGKFMDFADGQMAARQRTDQLKQQQAQKLAASWKGNQLKIKGGTIFQPEINDRANKVMQMGLDLQKAGVNPNSVATDPASQAKLEAYQQAKAELLRDVDARDEIAKQAQTNEKLLAANPDGYYDSSSVQAYHDYLSGKTPLSEITGKGLQMPELKKAFNLQPLVDKIPGVPIETTSVSKDGVKRKMILPNEDAHNQLASGLVNSNPEVQADISKKAGVPFDQIGDQTDASKLKKQLDDHYRSYPWLLPRYGISSYSDPAYDKLITDGAKSMANAARVKKDYISGIKETLDNKVHQADDKSYDFEYQDQQMQRERLGMEREKFADWKKNQQYEAGSFVLGNQDSFVPVIKQRINNGKPYNTKTGEDGEEELLPSLVQPERGASIFGVNLPEVSTVVRPSLITDTKTGRTVKNTEPVEVKVSQIQMVPVFKGLKGDDTRNGSEVSAKQLKEIISGTSKSGFSIKDITFKPFAYGLQSIKTKDANGNMTHSGTKPIKFSYDALKGSNVKKINTKKFDEAGELYKKIVTSDWYKNGSPEQQLEFLKKKFNLNLDE